MTEDEAKARWCPFSRVVRASESGIVASGQGAMNRFDVPDRTESPKTPLASNCMASACMAWRGLNDLTVVDPKADRHVTLRQGFCGLAGAPQ